MGSFIPIFSSVDWESIGFFAHPLRVLYEIFDPSKATFPLERDLKQCAFALRDASIAKPPLPFSLSPFRERGGGEGHYDRVAPKIS